MKPEDKIAAGGFIGVIFSGVAITEGLFRHTDEILDVAGDIADSL